MARARAAFSPALHERPGSEPGESSARAIVSLVFGILGILMLAPCAGPIVAIVVGMGEKGGGLKAGVILGWITLALYALSRG
jgi:cytochrome c biogenesis protein CcdA